MRHPPITNTTMLVHALCRIPGPREPAIPHDDSFEESVGGVRFRSAIHQPPENPNARSGARVSMRTASRLNSRQVSCRVRALPGILIVSGGHYGKFMLRYAVRPEGLEHVRQTPWKHVPST